MTLEAFATDPSRSSTDATRRCAWCTGPIPPRARRDAITCSKSCRQARHRFGRGCVPRERSTVPLRFAYADPPYPGKAWLYRGHRDYAGEVDHAELVSRLQGFDGWALSTSAAALPDVLALCAAAGVRVRVAAWLRGHRPRAGGAYAPLSAWEPVVYAGGRAELERGQAVDALDYFARPRRTDPDRVIGAKPATFIWWLFDLLGLRPGDELVDLYPGSGGIGRALALYNRRASIDLEAAAA